MRLEPLYRCTFAPTESWQRGVAAEAGSRHRGSSSSRAAPQGRLAARLRAANYPRQRTDGTLTPDFRGVLETDDGATIVFAWHGYGRPATTARGSCWGASPTSATTIATAG